MWLPFHLYIRENYSFIAFDWDMYWLPIGQRGWSRVFVILQLVAAVLAVLLVRWLARAAARRCVRSRVQATTEAPVEGQPPERLKDD